MSSGCDDVIRPGDPQAALPVQVERAAERIAGDGVRHVVVTVAEETPVAMVFNGTSHAVMIATPADLEDFGLGFALSEGIVAAPGEVLEIEARSVDGGAEVAMTITQRRFAALAERRRTLAGRTGCGLCGVDSLAQVLRAVPPLDADTRIAPDSVHRALLDLRERQTLNLATGAVHGAALCAADGRIVLLREDVGRHNALDKLLGVMAREKRPPHDGFVLLTSRCSFEMVQKAATCGIAVLVAISAPTALALRLAEEIGMTVVALARPDSMTVHTHGQRLGLPDPGAR